MFVRLTGCNLRCSWCDSEYTFTGGRKMAIEEVLGEVNRLSPGRGLVEITGGEPMLQAGEAVPLMERLLGTGTTCFSKPAESGLCSGFRREWSRLST